MAALQKLVQCCLTKGEFQCNKPMIYQLYAVTAPAADLAEQVSVPLPAALPASDSGKNCTTKRRIELAYPILQLCRDAEFLHYRR
ncbi:MAG: hypothetical protein ACLSFT_06805 [Ruminococcus callidus]